MCLVPEEASGGCWVSAEGVGVLGPLGLELRATGCVVGQVFWKSSPRLSSPPLFVVLVTSLVIPQRNSCLRKQMFSPSHL